MAVTEQARHRLYQRLEERLGHDEATTLMDHLPFGGWINIATKDDIVLLRRDLDEFRNSTTREFEGLRASTATEFEGLRTSTATKTDLEGVRCDLEGLRSSMTKDMEVMRSGVGKDIADLRSDLARRMLHYFVTLVTVSLTVAGLLAALIIKS